MLSEYAKRMNIIVFNTHICESVSIGEAQTYQIPLIDYAKKSNPNVDYEKFTKELLKKLNK